MQLGPQVLKFDVTQQLIYTHPSNCQVLSWFLKLEIARIAHSLVNLAFALRSMPLHTVRREYTTPVALLLHKLLTCYYLIGLD